LAGFSDRARIVPRMFDLVPYFVTEFFRQDPFRALGLMCLACLAISMTTDFDLLAALGFVDVDEPKEWTAPAA
jgi:hypothetical protein